MSITVSLSTAQKMVFLGWNKCTQFWYFDFNWRLDYIWDDYIKQMQMALDWEYICAPTAQEILDVLDKKIRWIWDFSKFFYHSFYIETRKYVDCNMYYFVCWYRWTPFFTSENLAEALAELWIWCKENSFLSNV